MEIGDFVEVKIYHYSGSRSQFHRAYGWIQGFGEFPFWWNYMEGEPAVVVKLQNGQEIYARPDEIKVLQTT